MTTFTSYKKQTMKYFINLTKRQTEFLCFIQKAHEGQKRKYTGDDYWKHPYGVACILNNAMSDPGLLIEVALGHDLYEDTEVTYGILVKFMLQSGYSTEETLFVSAGINALTDEYTTEQWPTWNRERRKSFETQRLSRILPDYQSVKYADLIDNTPSIVKHDKKFAEVYIREKEEILSKMRLGDITLLIQAYDCLKSAKLELCF